MDNQTLDSLNHALMSELLPVALAFVGAYLLKILIPALHSWAKRVGIDLDSRVDAKVQYVVGKWITYAEEHIEHGFQTGVVPLEEKGLAKFETAVAGIVSELPMISEEMAGVLVKSALNSYGLGAAVKGVDFLAQKLQPKQSK